MKTQIITGLVDEKEVFSEPQTALNDDWIRSARLQKAAEEGDEEAAKELEKLRQSYMQTE